MLPQLDGCPEELVVDAVIGAEFDNLFYKRFLFIILFVFEIQRTEFSSTNSEEARLCVHWILIDSAIHNRCRSRSHLGIREVNIMVSTRLTEWFGNNVISRPGPGVPRDNHAFGLRVVHALEVPDGIVMLDRGT